MLTSAEILGPQGSIARRLAHYEHRPEQLAMAEAVAHAMQHQHHLVAEAGTGVGKSFAYLVPAILAVCQPIDPKSPPKRLVVSTHTISLQEQLMQKDLPLLRSVIPLEFTAVLVKGRSNYLSLRRMNSAAARAGSLFHQEEEMVELRNLVSWSKETGDGSLADLSHSPLSQVWDEVQSDSGNCMGRQCPTYKECFYYRARRRAQNAQVLVVNHALFFSDLGLRQSGVSILPDYDAVIFDEAHTLEAVASDHLGDNITQGQIEFVLNKLYNDRTNKGLLVHRKLTAAQQEVEKVRWREQEFFDDVGGWLAERGKSTVRVGQPEIVQNMLSPALAQLAKIVKQEGSGLKDEEKQDFVAAANRLAALAGSVEAWRKQIAGDAVYWADSTRSRRGRPRITLSSAPLDIGPTLREHLFDKVPTVVMTSATLSVGSQGSFDFFKSRVGLTQTVAQRWGSPFDYQRQAELVLLDGMPDPTTDKDAYERAAVAMIKRYVARTDGHAFVLFTSYDMMTRVAGEMT